MEPGRSYRPRQSADGEASFTRSIANRTHIPYTTPIWKQVLPVLLATLVDAFRPHRIYLFGSKDYVAMVERCSTYKWMPELFEICRGRASDTQVRTRLVAVVRDLFGPRS